MSKEWTEAPGVLLFFELRPVVEQMSDADAGALLKQILKYGETGVADVELGEVGRIIWQMVKPRVDYSLAQYVKRQESSEKANKSKFLKSIGIFKDKYKPKVWSAILSCTRLDAEGHYQAPKGAKISELLDKWGVPTDERNGF